MEGCAVTIDQVSKAYGHCLAVDRATVHIRRGEFFSILGPSGCGKTTLLRIIAGFEQPDSGDLTFDHVSVLGVGANKRRSNTVFQSYALFPHLSVYENIAFPLRLKRLSKNLIRERVHEYLHLVQLDEHLHKKPHQLSGGQQQRVAIARALVCEPGVLLLDEPLSALDAKLRSNLLIELDTLHDQTGITFVFITHDQSEALSVSDRIAVMNKGKILQIGTPYEIYEQPATDFVAKFIGETNSFLSTVVSCTAIENEEFMLSLQVPELDRTLTVTADNPIDPGRRVCFTVRPEKIHISLEEPGTTSAPLNVFRGFVEEPVYAGFQSKFFVQLESGAIIQVFQQHQKYLDTGPEIAWKDTVYVSWSAHDGYVVEDIES